jgi:hypothetical protein
VRRLIHQGELRIKGDDGAIVIMPEDVLPSAELTLDDTDSDHSPPVSPSSSSSPSSPASSAATTDSLPKLARRSTSQLVRQRSFDANKHRSRIVPLSSTPPATWSSMSSLPALAPDADSSSTVDTPMAAAAALATVKSHKAKRGGSWLELGSSAGSGGLQTTSSRQLLPTLKMAGRSGSRGSSSSSSSSSSSRSYKKRYVFLFDDLLLETEPEKDGKFRFVRVHHLSECYIASNYHNEGTLKPSTGVWLVNVILTYCMCMLQHSCGLHVCSG